MTKEIPIIVLIDDEHRDQIDSVARILEANGLKLDSVLKIIGVITGYSDDEDLNKFNSLPGVASVERSVTNFATV